jgi:hypothetical protein
MDCLVTGLTFVAVLQNAQYPLVLCVIKVFGVSAFLVILMHGPAAGANLRPNEWIS